MRSGILHGIRAERVGGRSKKCDEVNVLTKGAPLHSFRPAMQRDVTWLSCMAMDGRKINNATMVGRQWAPGRKTWSRKPDHVIPSNCTARRTSRIARFGRRSGLTPKKNPTPTDNALQDLA